MSTALYRRYRPDTFADVIGQEHVTTPLMTALSKNRVNHAYLFSGPRGCGKTTSARILARCLNCAQGPTPTPCGVCPSCVELASGGPGSLDVIEIDAASHGGVEDARDLRERATFAPARDRYKVFIIDEAHMVTSAGFNALLKIVEEPPPHIKFIFATTEPDKVIGTIRSRTHHYPFRLVPPEALIEYLKVLCDRENVRVAEAVLPLVIRAGGGSVRDTLSVLDQLISGASEQGVDYETAIALLGYTHATLLDEVTLSLHTADGASLFDAIDRIIQTGLDPRRFVEDLLERFRDLIIAKAVPEGLEKILRGTPADQLTNLHEHSALFGAAELSRWADVTNQALTDMTGATSPRLHLELLAARLLLPAADSGESSVVARLDRLERHAMSGGTLPELSDNGEPNSFSNLPVSPEATKQGAAAVREALAAARARNHGQPTEAPEAQAPHVQADGTTQHSDEPQPSVDPPAAPETSAAPVETASAEHEPSAASPSLNTGQDADWGATWGPIDDSPSNPVTTPVEPAPSVPAERPEGIAPFSLVPDPSSGEDLSFGTGVSIDDVQQNAAMAEFTKRAAQGRAQHSHPPQAQNPSEGQPPQPETETRPQPSSFGPPSVEHAPVQQAEPEAELEATARAEEQQREQAAREQAAQREAAARAEMQQREQSEREAAARAEAQRREQAEREQAAQRAAAEREAEQRAAQTAREQQVRPQQQHTVPEPGQQGNAPAAGGSVQQFQQAWPTILQQLQANSKVLHSMVANYGSIAGFDGRTLTLGFSNTGPLVNLRNRPDMMGLLTNTIGQVMNQQVEVVLTEGGSGPSGGGGSPKGDRRPQPASAPVAERQSNPAADSPASTAPTPPPVPEPSPTPVREYDPAPYDEEPPYDEYEDAYAPQDYGNAVSAPAQFIEPAQQGAPYETVPSTPKPKFVAPQSSQAQRSFDGPPVAPRPRMTAGLAARQTEDELAPDATEEPVAPTVPHPVSDRPLRPGSTTDPARTPAVNEAPRPATPVTPAHEPPAAAPRPRFAQTPVGGGQTLAQPSAPSWGQPPSTQPQDSTGSGSGPAGNGTANATPPAGQKLSRYQQLMNQAQRANIGPVETSAASWGQPQTPVPQRSTPQPEPKHEPDDFVPSEDDIAVEDSNLIGVPAVERLLGGMVIEQRDANNNVIEIPRGL